MYFVTDLSAALPSVEEWPEVWQAQQEWRAGKKEHDTAKTAVRLLDATATRLGIRNGTVQAQQACKWAKQVRFCQSSSGGPPAQRCLRVGHWTVQQL